MVNNGKCANQKKIPQLLRIYVCTSVQFPMVCQLGHSQLLASCDYVHKCRLSVALYQLLALQKKLHVAGPIQKHVALHLKKKRS